MNETKRLTGNIYLVGMMGSGKTTVGRALAKRLNRRFVDSDHEIEARTGASIPWIFEIEGEACFRQREAEVIRNLCAQDDIVLATGGGAILDPDSRALLHRTGTVIYLHTSVSSILHRTAHDKNRPLLQTENPRKRIEELSQQREPYYREAAHIVIETGRPNVQSLVQEILSRLQQLQRPSASSNAPAGNPMQPQEPITLNVALAERSYPILIGPGLLDQPGLLAQSVPGRRAAVVSNAVVAPLYLERVEKSLAASGKEVMTIVLPDGEEEKNWSVLMRIFDALLQEKCDRKTTIIALGGGVVGDMAGFAAATYMRGVPYVQIPTTLLAQVDSSVGGKTAINHPLGKNMIGAFYQPQAVLADTATLDTLAPRELAAGLAEVIKYGAIMDAPFFAWLEANIARLNARDPQALAYAIRRSCELKADVVRQDEREGGLRAILNFGHTFGHVIEAGLGYGQWLHGEAVGCGMVMAADLSQRLGYIDATEKERLLALVQAAGLPVTAPYFPVEQWLDMMQIDKKTQDGTIRFILMKPLGTHVITAVPQEALRATLNACMSAP